MAGVIVLAVYKEYSRCDMRLAIGLGGGASARTSAKF